MINAPSPLINVNIDLTKAPQFMHLAQKTSQNTVSDIEPSQSILMQKRRSRQWQAAPTTTDEETKGNEEHSGSAAGHHNLTEMPGSQKQ